MKAILQNLLAAIILLAASLQAHAQGLTYDQQSATSPAPFQGRDGFNIQADQLTQSFIPALSAIGFIQFQFFDVPNNGNNGATVYVNLWSGSPNINSATLLGSTTPVYMSEGFDGITNFFFSTVVALSSGQTYYFQPVVLSGDNPWAIVVLTNTYPNGQLFASGGAIQPTMDMWFREGIVSAPEPSIAALAGLSGLLAATIKLKLLC